MVLQLAMYARRAMIQCPDGLYHYECKPHASHKIPHVGIHQASFKCERKQGTLPLADDIVMLTTANRGDLVRYTEESLWLVRASNRTNAKASDKQVLLAQEERVKGT